MQGFPQLSLTMGQEGRSVQAAGAGQAVTRDRIELHERRVEQWGPKEGRGGRASRLIKPPKFRMCVDIVIHASLARVHYKHACIHPNRQLKYMVYTLWIDCGVCLKFKCIQMLNKVSGPKGTRKKKGFSTLKELSRGITRNRDLQ